MWWCDKYKAPPTDPRYLAYTQERLWIEFFRDLLRYNPNKFHALSHKAHEKIQYVTGDKAFDEIEAANAAGDDAAVLRMLKEWDKVGVSSKAKTIVGDDEAAEREAIVEEIDDNYADRRRR